MILLMQRAHCCLRTWVFGYNFHGCSRLHQFCFCFFSLVDASPAPPPGRFTEMIAPHTVVFGHHLSAIAAQQIAGMACNIAGFISLPIGAVLTDRCERKW